MSTDRLRVLYHAGNHDPYRIPDDGMPRVINFSGGRTSGFMLHRILEAHQGELPGNTRVIFCNTGKERAETLLFVHRCGKRWGVPIVWLEYAYNPNAAGGRHHPKNIYKKVDLRSASFTGRPFSTLIRASSILPNVSMRKCTSELKVRTVERYMLREHGVYSTRFKNVLGIRYDEKRRWSKTIFQECRIEFPLVHAGVDEAEVMEFWARQPFCLGITSDEGNCDLCFLKGKGKLLRLIRQDPGRADWWINQESLSRKNVATRGLRKSEMAQFSKRYSYAQLKREALTTRELPFEVEERSISCFCGD